MDCVRRSPSGGVGDWDWGVRLVGWEDNWYVQLLQSVLRAEVSFQDPGNAENHFHVGNPYLAC